MAYKIVSLTSPNKLPAQIKQFEARGLPKHQLIKFFQSIIVAGMAYRLKGPYKDITSVLIKNKICFPVQAINDNAPLQQSNNIAL